MKAIFDIGANDGADGLRLASQNPEIRVYAFEPTPELIPIIQAEKKKIETLSGRRLDNHHLIQKAVADFNGTASFNVAGQKNWGCSSLFEFESGLEVTWPGRTDFKVTHTINVEVTRLDEFCEAEGITQIPYLHCDTQGADLAVLKGLGKYRACLEQGIIEVAASRYVALYKEQHILEDVVLEFLKWGYEITRVIPDGPLANELNIAFRNKWPLIMS
ncbi:MAG: FkbM family methyltransferase [Rhodospirillaceae bacterium]|nr:FkbM family methyltransferase [Rhodospirillaceae bacterium]